MWVLCWVFVFTLLIVLFDAMCIDVVCFCCLVVICDRLPCWWFCCRWFGR